MGGQCGFSNIHLRMQFLSLLLLLPIASWAMSVGNEDAMSFFPVPDPRSDYSFGEGGRPRMGKREYGFADGGRPRMGKRDPVEDSDLLDGGLGQNGMMTPLWFHPTRTDPSVEIAPVIRLSKRRSNYIPSFEPPLRNYYVQTQNFKGQEKEEKKRGGLRTRLGRML